MLDQALLSFDQRYHCRGRKGGSEHDDVNDMAALSVGMSQRQSLALGGLRNIKTNTIPPGSDREDPSPWGLVGRASCCDLVEEASGWRCTAAVVWLGALACLHILWTPQKQILLLSFIVG